MTQFENSLRVWVSRWNARRAENVMVHKLDEHRFELRGDIAASVVAMPATGRDSKAKAYVEKQGVLIDKSVPVPVVEVEPVEVEHPTKEEFLNYILGFVAGQSYTFETQYLDRFEDFIDWMIEIPGEPFGYALDNNDNPTKLAIWRKG